MFKNRKDAGFQLAEELCEYDFDNPIVLGIARGGVEIGFYIAVELNCEFSLVLVSKLGYPDQPEAAFGALAEDGRRYLSSRAKKLLSDEEIESITQRE